jgi:hypothetical protein
MNNEQKQHIIGYYSTMENRKLTAKYSNATQSVYT